MARAMGIHTNPDKALEGRNIPRDVGLVSPLRGYAIRSDRYPRLTPWATDISPLCGCRNLKFFEIGDRIVFVSLCYDAFVDREDFAPLVMTFAICLDNEGYEASLELRKIYQVLPPEDNDPQDYVRIVDESGEDYLYHKKGFELIELPQRTERKLLATLR
jgi:hypothetical protein